MVSEPGRLWALSWKQLVRTHSYGDRHLRSPQIC